MATKAKKPTTSAPDAADDLLGGTPPADDLLGGDAAAPKAKAAAKSKANGKAKPAAKAAKADKPAAKAKAEKAPKEPKAAKAAAATNRGPKGSGKFYMDPDELAALQKKIGTQKKPLSSKELAEKFETDTWKARTAAAALVKAGKGSMAKVGSTLVYTPA